MSDVNSNPGILSEIQNDVSKFFDMKIGILEHQELRLERLLESVRLYSTSYKDSKNRALSSLQAKGEPVTQPNDTVAFPEIDNRNKEEARGNREDKRRETPTKIELGRLFEDEQESVTFPSSDLLYDKKWNHSQKVQFVTLEPHRYGVKTFDGSNSVVDAILTHEPEWGKRESRAAILSKIAPTISKLVKRKKIVKLKVKGSKAEFRYISKRWFGYNDVIKAEYVQVVADLELVGAEKKLTPVRAGANAKSETNIGEKASKDAPDNEVGLIRQNVVV